MNNITFEKLQYNELKNIVKNHCISDMGKDLVDKLKPSCNLPTVQNRLEETGQSVVLLSSTGHVPLPVGNNIKQIIKNLEKGMSLEVKELESVLIFIKDCRKLKNYMVKNESLAPSLSAYANGLSIFSEIENEIDNTINSGEISDDATKELKSIRKKIVALEEKINEKIKRFINNSDNKRHIQERFVSIRNGHYTIPIKAESKNIVSGTIIDYSSKGSTVFIEPNSVSKLSNEMSILKVEEEVEIYQILATLSGLLSEVITELLNNIEIIAQYDFVFAKGKYSLSIKGIIPKINDHGYIKLIKCKHPLLDKDVVPLDFKIGNDYRSLIITGPNAGGKTIVLKTIGLLTLAVMSGFHITGDEKSEISIFEKVFVDIGDNQSLENALSTFSAHMKNISDIIKEANNSTLILFDEIGSGTDPKEGSALAISILEHLYLKGCITVATTHYGEIKDFSMHHPDFINAAMKFDQETLAPLYKLVIGVSGESNALWIANKMNLSLEIQKNAKRYMENNNYEFNMLDDSKRRKPKIVEEIKEEAIYEYQQGDRVLLLEYNDHALVYEGIDDYNNVKVYYKKNFIDVNVRRLKLEYPAEVLYPVGYDMEQLFSGFEDRKFEKDMARGSKKALKKVKKEIKDSKKNIDKLV